MGSDLADIAFPHRKGRQFGVTSFALVFVMLFFEIEGIVAVALLLAGRLSLFLDFQPLIAPSAVLVSLTTALVFAWRARTWTRRRIARAVGTRDTALSGYAERIAQQHRSHG
ncbi:MAG TPA: hypothetical protein VFM93_09610 [Candidatus Limnocylindria bacterium]|nr:hypothetical protein [Candidatus Limnocylindria bacterium]